MSDVWHDNRPCDRALPGEWAFAIIVVIGLLAFAVFFSWFYAGRGGSLPLAVLFAALGGIFGGYLLLLVVLIEREFANQVSFRVGELVWRTRSGKTRAADYSRVVEVLPWPWWAAIPRRYLVVLRADRYPPRKGLWINHENKARLQMAMRGAREP